MTRGWWLAAWLVAGLAAVGAAGRWTGGDPAGPGVPGMLFPGATRDGPPPGEVADRAERRLEEFLAGAGAVDSLVLSESEVAAVIGRRLGERLPRGVSDLRVELSGRTAAVSAVVRFGRLRTGGDAPRRVSQLLGDSARVELEVEPAVVGPGSGRLTLRGLRAGELSVPEGLLPVALRRLGIEAGREGDGPTVRVPLPRAVSSIGVGEDRLVLRRRGR